MFYSKLRSCQSKAFYHEAQKKLQRRPLVTAERQRGCLFLEAPPLTKTLTPFVGASTFD